MAVFQLGAIVTKIKGSIGGTAFKTQRATNVMFRKSNGYSRSKLLNNRALQYARYIFVRWGYLSPVIQSGWQNMAAIVFFPDKFGNQVHISGRQLYTKTNINLKQALYYESISPDFSMEIPVLDVEPAFINPATKFLSLGVEYFDGKTAYVEVSAQVSINNLQSPVYNRRETLIFPLVTGAELLQLGTEFFNKFPYVVDGYNVRLYVTPVNIYGIKGTPIAVPVNWSLPVLDFTLSPYIVTSSWNVFLPVAGNLPAGTVYRSYYQSDAVSMPVPDFSLATLFDEQVLDPALQLSYGIDLNLLPPNLRFGGFVRVWVEPVLPDTTVLPAKSVIWGAQPIPLYNFAMDTAIQYNDNTVVASTTNDFPPGTTFRVSFQNGGAVYPAPDFDLAQTIGEFTPDISGNIDLSTTLFDPPFSIDPLDKLLLWFRPRNAGVDIDTALPIQLAAVIPAGAGVITRAKFDVLDGPLLISSNEIYDNPTAIPIATSNSIELFVYFAGWTVADNLPDPALIQMQFDPIGLINVVDLLNLYTWDAVEKCYYFHRDPVAFDITATASVPPQDVPLVP